MVGAAVPVRIWLETIGCFEMASPFIAAGRSSYFAGVFLKESLAALTKTFHKAFFRSNFITVCYLNFVEFTVKLLGSFDAVNRFKSLRERI